MGEPSRSRDRSALSEAAAWLQHYLELADVLLNRKVDSN
jgi:hypothetical protein